MADENSPKAEVGEDFILQIINWVESGVMIERTNEQTQDYLTNARASIRSTVQMIANRSFEQGRKFERKV
jgi:hypothetical protein